MGGLSYNPAMSDELRMLQEQQDAETRQAFREAGVDVEGLSPEQYNAAIEALGEWRNLPENRAYRNQRSAIGKFVDSIGGPAGLFALTAGGLFLAQGGLGALGGSKAAGGLAGVKAPTAGSLLAPPGTISQAGIIEAGLMSGGVTPAAATTLASGGGGLGAALSSAAGKVGSVISSAAGALGGGGSMGALGKALALGGAEIIGGLFEAKAIKDASKNAAKMQGQATEAELAGLREARTLLEEKQASIEAALEPFTAITPETIQNLGIYSKAGLQALSEQAAILGLEGPEAQEAAIAALEASPRFQALARQGEEALLQRASATGGLRGGDIQGALGQFRPAMLQSFINQQYERLGGLSGQGLGVLEGLFEAGYGAGGRLAGLRQTQAANLSNVLTGQGMARAEGLANLGNIQSVRERDQGAIIGSGIDALGDIAGRYFGGYFDPAAASPAASAPFGGYDPAQININAGLPTPIF